MGIHVMMHVIHYVASERIGWATCLSGTFIAFLKYHAKPDFSCRQFSFPSPFVRMQDADSMLCTQEFPELCANLIATLPHLPHGKSTARTQCPCIENVQYSLAGKVLSRVVLNMVGK